jgi:hypothetical protein
VVWSEVFAKSTDKALGDALGVFVTRPMPSSVEAFLASYEEGMRPFVGLSGFAGLRMAQRQASVGDVALPSYATPETMTMKVRFDKLMLGVEASAGSMAMAWKNRQEAYLAARPARVRPAEKKQVAKGMADVDAALKTLQPALGFTAGIVEDVSLKNETGARAALGSLREECVKVKSQVLANGTSFVAACANGLPQAELAIEKAFGKK